MKNLLFVLITIFSLSNFAHAQSVKFGLKGGLNIANLTGDDAEETDRNNLLGFHAGVVSEIKFSDKFSLQPEVVYSTQGTEIENSVKIKLDYLTVPILAKYYPVNNFSVELGPQFSFLTNDKIKFNDGSPEVETNAENVDIGAALGLGYKIGDHIFTQLRYNFGLTTVDDNPDVKNSVFQLSLGYNF